MSETATLSETLDIKLPLNNAFISYCAGINAAQEWDIGGINGHKDRSKSINFDCVEIFLKSLKSGKTPARKHVVDFAVQLFSDYWSGENIIKKHFNETLFYFIIGPARSGGTYLLTQMYQAIGIDYSSISRAVVRDSIPGSKHLVRGQIQAKDEIYAIFELCQFLAWAKEELNQSVIIQKNTCYAHWMPTLNKIFGEQAHYLITARAPVACVASFIQLGLGFEDWEELISYWKQLNLGAEKELALPQTSLRLKEIYRSKINAEENPTVADLLLINWQLHYQDIILFRPQGDMTVVEYGDPMLNFFASRHPHYLRDNPTGLDWITDNRDYASFMDDFNIDPALVNHTALSVYKAWRENQMDFPNFARNL